MEGLRSAVPISSRAVQQCSKRRRGPGRLVYKSTRLLQQSLVYKSRQSLPFVCRSTLLRPEKGWRSLPDIGERLPPPPAPAAIPRLYNALRNTPFSVWWSGGWANRAAGAISKELLIQICFLNCAWNETSLRFCGWIAELYRGREKRCEDSSVWITTGCNYSFATSRSMTKQSLTVIPAEVL